MLGIELNHLPEALYRAFKIQHVLEGASELAVGVGILRIELDHPQETSGPTELSPAQQTTKLLFYKCEYANKHEAVNRLLMLLCPKKTGRKELELKTC